MNRVDTDFFSSALRVTKPLKSVQLPETQVATLECEVSHFNVPSTWLRDGVEIEMSEKFRIVVQGKLHQLKIMNTSRDDSAEYTFVCGNDRVSATLTVSRKLLSLSAITDGNTSFIVMNGIAFPQYFQWNVSNCHVLLLFSSHPHHNDAARHECSGKRHCHI